MKILCLAKFILLFGIFSVFVFGQEKTETTKSQVFLNIRVVGRFDEPVTDLKADNFRLFENKKPLKISSFSSENSPVSVGFLIDVSRSMESSVDTSREA